MTAFDEKVVAITRMLENAGVPYAIGGAIALAYYAVPRATVDIDVNIFLRESAGTDIVRSLAALGIQSAANTLPTIKRDGQTRLQWDNTPVDLFFAYDAFHDNASTRTRDVPYPPDRIRILAGEDLMVCKVVFDRGKDWLDIDQMLLATAGDLDVRDVRKWVVHIAGEGDQRTAHLDDAIVRMLGPEALSD